MPWACAASAFCSLGMSTLWEPLHVRCIDHVGFSSLSRGILCQPQHHPSEQQEQTQCILTSMVQPVESEASFLLDFCPLPLEFLPDLPAFLFLPTSMFSLPRVLCCSTPALEEFELSSAEVFPCWLPCCGTSGCVGWWIGGGMSQIPVELCLPVSCSDSSYGLTSFPSCQLLENT